MSNSTVKLFFPLNFLANILRIERIISAVDRLIYHANPNLFKRVGNSRYSRANFPFNTSVSFLHREKDH